MDDDEFPRRAGMPDMTKSMVSGKANPVKFVRARAGKGAVSHYGVRRTRSAEQAYDTSGTEARRQQASMHKAKSLPESQIFSLPSSSFNASSWVSSGVAPPLAGRNVAGIGQGYSGRTIEPKRTALIMPGQGSQYITMAQDLYQAYPAARGIWEEAEDAITSFIEGKEVRGMPDSPMRAAFEDVLRQGQSLNAAVTPRGIKYEPGWLRKAVFQGSQLDLTRSEMAMPAILTATLSFLSVLRHELGMDVVRDHVQWAAGHGSGVYAALVSTGSLSKFDAWRAVRYRGLAAMKCLQDHPVLFPSGSQRPANLYETWAFANMSFGKGRALQVDEDGNPKPVHENTWRGTQISAVVLRYGQLQNALEEVKAVQADIQQGAVPGISPEEFVATSNINSEVQIVVAGTIVGVNYACDRLRYKGYGARAVNVPVSGPYHTSFVHSATEQYSDVIKYLPIELPSDHMRVVSSVDGSILTSEEAIRHDLSVALSEPVRWLDTINTLVQQGVQRFVCLGPGRAIAQQLSKELALRERAQRRKNPGQQQTAGTLDDEPSPFEVWSVTTAEGVAQLVTALQKVPPTSP
ncbi:malonyl -acyl carrier protein transacylase [Malassezia pachydermatis]|uniref:[acyl-carrier-protein] S-malonyltransferase n=1 Tax=Malassezia pachydermatis TaxID=77020 RepID=A0A0M8MMT6_9BASI|nr:malonyl -acyl carrier protein transacylase [Malassezia pachydermatis]KOS13277.1 malonyl -acyl carrier protein transacylase [Malassezia pachydermatis]